MKYQIKLLYKLWHTDYCSQNNIYFFNWLQKGLNVNTDIELHQEKIKTKKLVNNQKKVLKHQVGDYTLRPAYNFWQNSTKKHIESTSHDRSRDTFWRQYTKAGFLKTLEFVESRCLRSTFVIVWVECCFYTSR